MRRRCNGLAHTRNALRRRLPEVEPVATRAAPHAAAAPGRGRRAVVGAPAPGAPGPMPTCPLPLVLVADDDPDLRAYIRSSLRAAARVAEAADGAEALALARRETPDLVIADVRMPGLDGHALCAALHADAATAAVPVLLVSGEPPGTRACAEGFLAKPFNAAGLRAAVALLLVRPP